MAEDTLGCYNRGEGTVAASPLCVGQGLQQDLLGQWYRGRYTLPGAIICSLVTEAKKGILPSPLFGGGRGVSKDLWQGPLLNTYRVPTVYTRHYTIGTPGSNIRSSNSFLNKH